MSDKEDSRPSEGSFIFVIILFLIILGIVSKCSSNSKSEEQATTCSLYAEQAVVFKEYKDKNISSEDQKALMNIKKDKKHHDHAENKYVDEDIDGVFDIVQKFEGNDTEKLQLIVKNACLEGKL